MRASSLIAFIAVIGWSSCRNDAPIDVPPPTSGDGASMAMYSDPEPKAPTQAVRPLELHPRRAAPVPAVDEPTAPPKRLLPALPQCDPDDGTKRTFTAAEREETRDRVKRTCETLGAAPIICAYMDAIVIRESSGNPGVRHHLGVESDGKVENGLGALGLSLRWHHDKWPGKDEDPYFCSPEVSAVVAHSIFWRAVDRYQADTIPDIQSIYGGFWQCHDDPDTGKRVGCFPSRDYGPNSDLCQRMKRRGYNCYKPIRPKDLGRKIPLRDRRKFALDLMNTWVYGLPAPQN